MYHKKFKIIISLVLALIIGLAIFAYLTQDELVYDKVEFSELKNWENQDFVLLRDMAIGNCKQGARYYKNKTFDEKFGNVYQWRNFCKGLKYIEPHDSKAIKAYFEKLVPMHVHQPFDNTSLFTGYYSPLLHGSYTKTEEYNYPIYKRPENLVEAHLKDFFEDDKYKFRKIFAKVENGRIKPYYTRKQIDDDGVLSDKDVIVWVNDKVAAFFLHIQGSGEVMIDETGERIHVGYAGQNGHSYYAIGRYMVKEGFLKKEEVSLQSIREFLDNNPDQIDEILNQNPSYIFFAKRKDGPYGAFNKVLTPNYSVATDRRFVPLGTPMFFETAVTATGEEFNKMVFSQDIGGAIKGAVRADIYFGADEKAEEYSGKQNNEGRMYVFSAENF
jgi:membrane-bound lytic murein transglycosylase A